MKLNKNREIIGACLGDFAIRGSIKIEKQGKKIVKGQNLQSF